MKYYTDCFMRCHRRTRCTILYYTILYYTILYYTILTTLYCRMSVVLYANSPASLSRLRITHSIVIVHNTQYSVHSTQASESLHASAKPCYRQHAHDTILYSFITLVAGGPCMQYLMGLEGGGGISNPPPVLSLMLLLLLFHQFQTI